jgi:hypothetical protein
MNSAVSPQQHWQQHVKDAVLKFLKTAVVIDNQPYVQSRVSQLIEPAQNTGLGDDASVLAVPEHTVSSADVHDLDIRNITDAFINQGIACAFVLPEEQADDSIKIQRALQASKVSDLVVIDWYLKDADESLTLQILEQIARSDIDEKGRLRLVCVYTGQPLTERIFNEILNSFRSGGINLQPSNRDAFCASSQNTLVILRNKSETPVTELPILLIQNFAQLADGLVPSFALAAVGAVRKNVHHLVTRFSASLDPAYISNRLITNPPSDVTELMRELLVAEFDNAVGLEKVADEYLDKTAIHKWLSNNTDNISIQGSGSSVIDISFLYKLLNVDIKADGLYDLDGQKIPLNEKKKLSVTVAVAGSQDNSNNSQSEFSRLVIFKREAFGSFSTKISSGWKPSLTTGTLLRGSNNKYYVCFTPACDTLRLTEPSSFVFLEVSISEESYNIVFTDFDGSERKLRFEKKRPKLSTHVFRPDDTQRVRAEWREDNARFTFTESDDDEEYIWLGELRYGRATSEMAQIIGNWMRIGVNDSEYLRIAGK